jgi:hypothetical protein
MGASTNDFSLFGRKDRPMRNLLAAAWFCAFAASALAGEPAASADQPKITVTGEALVYARPDKIILNLGIETRDTEWLEAKRKNTEIWKKAAAVLKACGVAEKEVQTDYLSVEPVHKNGPYDNAAPIGYTTRNMFVVTLSDPGQVETVISKMLEAGVNHVNGVEFQTTQFKRHRESARELALKAAKEKAEKMAAVLGGAIGRPLTITDTYGGGSWYFSSWSGWGYGRGSMMSQNVIQDTRGSGGEDLQSMALGKVSIRAAVSVTFELK